MKNKLQLFQGCVPAMLFSMVGIVIAVALSWSVNHSIVWAIIQGAINWFYVTYFVIRGIFA